MRHSRIEKAPPAARDWLGTDAKVLRHVHVCGDGCLAVATRIELKRLGIQRESDYLLPPLRAPLVIACSDGDSDDSFLHGAQRALDEGSPLLFGGLSGRLVRLGPLIDPAIQYITSCCAQAGVRDAPVPRAPAAEPDPDLNLHARLGALLISAQILNFLLGARKQCLLDRVVELNPWSMESKGYRVFKVRQ